MAGNVRPKALRKRSDDKRGKAMVLIASADAKLRQKWALGLQDAFAVYEVLERAELESAMTNSKSAVLLLDSELPQLHKVKGVPTIQRLSPSTKIIVLSSADNEKATISALKAGAKGYCNKQIEPPLLRKAVNVVQKGEIWVGRKTISRILARLTSLTESHQKAIKKMS